jgi:hypothetical protein
MKALARTLLCAWVLWTAAYSGHYTSAEKMYQDWSFAIPIDAYATKAECRKAVPSFKGANGDNIPYASLCLPVGVDPRPRIKLDTVKP